MYLSVELAGCVASWRMRDSYPVSCWLKSCPWKEAGGIRPVRISGREIVSVVSEAFRREIWAGDDASSGVRVCFPDWGDFPPTDLASALTTALSGAPIHMPWRNLRRRLSQELELRPLFFILPPVGDAQVKILDEAVAMVEELEKTGTRSPLTGVVLETPSFGSGTGYFDLSIGAPVDGLFHNGASAEQELWSTYLHTRIAWETAGNIVEARRLACRCGSLRRGNTAELERLSNEYSVDRLAATGEGPLPELRAYVALLLGAESINMGERRALEAFLVRRGLLWKPIGDHRSRLTPWLTRALILRKWEPRAHYWFRDCLRVAPIVRDVLSKCFELEASERALYSPIRSLTEPPDRVKDLYKDFQARTFGSAARFYPAKCPVDPDPWSFASIWEFFSNLPEDEGTPYRHDLRVIRNALSHGHYVSWEMVRRVWDIEKRLNNELRRIPEVTWLRQTTACSE